MTAGDLRRARLARGLTLGELALRTRIRPSLLQKIDQGDFANLPGGIYARSFIKAYADAVGLDGDAIVRQVAEELPSSAVAPAAESHAERQPASDPEARMAALRGLLERDQAERVLARARVDRPEPGAFDTPDTRQRRILASVVDGLILAAVYVVVTALTALACGVNPSALPRPAAPALFLLFLLIGTLYFVLFGGIAGRTPGGQLMKLAPRDLLPRPLDLAEIGRRGWRMLTAVRT